MVPAVTGWYLVETDTPLAVLEHLPAPRGVAHYKIAERYRRNHRLITLGLTITPTAPGNFYVVYSGEHGNLKARAREHTQGHEKTGCLCLSQYQPLHGQRWNFKYLPFSVLGVEDDKRVRVLVEQKWRATNGWPLLCDQ